MKDQCWKCNSPTNIICDKCDQPVCSSHSRRAGLMTDTFYRCTTIDFCHVCPSEPIKTVFGAMAGHQDYGERE